MLVQLNDAATIFEAQTASAGALDQDPDAKADCDRVLRVLASAIRVLLEVPGAWPAELPRGAFADWPRLKWRGALPPVRLD